MQLNYTYTIDIFSVIIRTYVYDIKSCCCSYRIISNYRNDHNFVDTSDDLTRRTIRM